MFISTLRYDDVDNYNFSRFKNFLSLKIYLGYVFFTWQKQDEVLKFLKYRKLLSNKDFSKAFSELLVYIYTNVQLFLNFIFIILVAFFDFEAQIIYMWSLKLFQVTKILLVATFDIIRSSKFATNCVDRSLPRSIWRW